MKHQCLCSLRVALTLSGYGFNQSSVIMLSACLTFLHLTFAKIETKIPSFWLFYDFVENEGMMSFVFTTNQNIVHNGSCTWDILQHGVHYSLDYFRHRLDAKRNTQPSVTTYQF